MHAFCEIAMLFVQSAVFEFFFLALCSMIVDKKRSVMLGSLGLAALIEACIIHQLVK